MTVKPKALVLTGDGINCDAETEFALTLAGFESRRAHTFDLLQNPLLLNQVELLVLPGGFSFGDEIASGKVLAVKLKERFKESLYSFVDQGKLVIGICNGFQVLVQLGLLPLSKSGDRRVVSLLHNSHGRFLNRWVKLKVSDQKESRFLKGLTDIELPVRHGEGRLSLQAGLGADSAEAELVRRLGVLRYDEDINGSFEQIAALTNEEDTVFGIMPHPEAFVRWTQHPNWTARLRPQVLAAAGHSHTARQQGDQAPGQSSGQNPNPNPNQNPNQNPNLQHPNPSQGQVPGSERLPDGLAIFMNVASSLTDDAVRSRSPMAGRGASVHQSASADVERIGERPQSYAEAGVDVKKGEAFVDRLKNYSRRDAHDRLWKGAGGYASVVPITDNEAVALTTDGVGTKLLLALEANDLSTIGVDLVAMCANDLVCVGARPKSFLDYYATGKIEDDLADSLIMGITRGCDLAQMILVGGETAELPDLYRDRHFDVAGFAMGTVTRSTLLTGATIAPGDTVIGVASSGIHSNGLSLARKLIAPGHELRNQLLIPTHIYVKPILRLFDTARLKIKGIAHITGGGWRNLFRLNENVGFAIDEPLPVSEIFKELSKSVALDEMYRTFNMGMGLTIIAPELSVPDIIEAFRASGFTAKTIGVVTEEAQSMKIKHRAEQGKVTEVLLRH